MSSPLSPIIANIVMQEILVIEKLFVQLSFYFRYMNDIVLVAQSNSINDIQKIFNLLQ